MRPIRALAGHNIPAIAIGAALSAAASAQEPAIRYAVADIRFAPKADDALGTRRSGALCIPSGTVRWRDAKPDRAEAVTAVNDAFAERGLPTTASSGSARGARYAISGELRRVSLNPCVPPKGIGSIMNRSRTTKGTGEIVMVWRIEEADGSSPGRAITQCAAFQFKGSGVSLAAMTLKGVHDAALQLADALTTGEASMSAADRSGDPACR